MLGPRNPSGTVVAMASAGAGTRFRKACFSTGGGRSFIGATVLVMAMALGGSSCERCRRFRQSVNFQPADAEISALAAACASKMAPAANATCPAPGRNQETSGVDCFCRPLCERVLEVIDPFAAEESLFACHLTPGDAANGLTVVVEFGACQ